MPSLWGQSVNISSSENTMSDAAQKSGLESKSRLIYRYGRLHYEVNMQHLCEYLRANGDQNNVLDPYRTAERALYPGFGAIGLNRNHCYETALYYWVAANDESITMSTTDDRRAAFITALTECEQRFDRTATIQNESVYDSIICEVGVRNKFAEYFTLMHPDVHMVQDIQGVILSLVKGFIAQHCYNTLQMSYEELVAQDGFDFIASNIKQQINDKIESIIGWAMTQNERNYLNNILGFLSELKFETIRNERLNLLEPLSEIEINKLISDADNHYNERSTNNTTNNLRLQRSIILASEETRVKQMVSSIIPDPSIRNTGLTWQAEDAWWANDLRDYSTFSFSSYMNSTFVSRNSTPAETEVRNNFLRNQGI